MINISYKCIAAEEDFTADCNIINEKESICLLVGSVLECAVVYMQVLIT